MSPVTLDILEHQEEKQKTETNCNVSDEYLVQKCKENSKVLEIS